MKLPLYDITINLEDEDTGMTAISLVDDPAVETDFLAFKKAEKPLNFAVQDEMEHKITGVAIRADMPIYRCDPDGYEYYVRFSKQTIQDIVLKYSKQGLFNYVDLQHDGEMIDGVTMIEYYIKDTEKGISPRGFEDIEEGSLFCTYKIEDEKLWNDIVADNSQFNGFSIEVFADLQPTQETIDVEQQEDYDMNPEIEELLKWLCGLDDVDVVFESEKKKNELELDFEVERTDVARAIDQQHICNIKIGDKGFKEYYIHSLGKYNGKDVAILYDPSTQDWTRTYLSRIKEIVVTTKPIGDFVYTPSYEDVIDSDEVTIQRTVIVSEDEYMDAIKNKQWVMITYNYKIDNDVDNGKAATLSRQCLVTAYGTTKAGNAGIRVYERFGDSKSAKEGEGFIPDWRILLIKRITSWKVIQGVEPWTDADLGYGYHSGGDNSLNYPLFYAHTLGE